MSNAIKYLLMLGAWIAALAGTLQFHQLDLNLGHGICGPWGCGPPIEALLGYHGFWLTLIVPIAIAVGAVLPIRSRRQLGFLLLIGGIMTVVAYVVRDGMVYHAKADELKFVAQRAFFALVTAVDAPMLQVSVAGLCLWVWSRRTSNASSANSAPADPVDLGLEVPQASSADPSNPFQPPQTVVCLDPRLEVSE